MLYINSLQIFTTVVSYISMDFYFNYECSFNCIFIKVMNPTDNLIFIFIKKFKKKCEKFNRRKKKWAIDYF